MEQLAEILRANSLKEFLWDSYVYFVHSYYVPLCDETAASVTI